MTDQLPYFYEAEVEWEGGKNVSVRSAGLPEVQVAPPPEFQGSPGLWTPEHLYVASVNTCFAITFLAIAELSKFDFVRFSSSAVGKLEKVEGSGHEITEIVLKPTIILRDIRDADRAARLFEKAEGKCLILKSIKTIVRLQPEFHPKGANTLVA
jgi:organic hydroperoxide reductase OsmC/OhrA